MTDYRLPIPNDRLPTTLDKIHLSIVEGFCPYCGVGDLHIGQGCRGTTRVTCHSSNECSWQEDFKPEDLKQVSGVPAALIFL
ncbi:hypothetical protein [Cylindrospermum stagnale]|uniref:hypothetical protein n=1 Tax=Cylindrospermum stagnale TaxID=142864 RepID=UPI0012F702A3|nr:hypothetical protein [Cylindrospermum stagnale]